MAAPRRVVELAFSDEETAELARLARSRTEPASRVERARMLVAYRETPSFYAVGLAIGVKHQTVERCVRRVVVAALDDGPRPGRGRSSPTKRGPSLSTWVAGKPRTSAIPTNCGRRDCLRGTFASTARGRDTNASPRSLKGTLCKILAAHEVKPHKVRYYLERRDPEFDAKMAEVLCVYREVQLLKQSALAQEGETPAVAIVSYDEKPGVQAIGTTAPDLPPVPSRHACLARDHEYVRHGTLSLLAGIDLLTGAVHASVEERHRSREFVAFLQKLDAATPPIRRRLRSSSSSTTTRHTCPRKPGLGSPPNRKDDSPSSSPQSTAPGSIWSRASCTLRAAPHPRCVQARIEGSNPGRHRRHQPRPCRPHLDLQAR